MAIAVPRSTIGSALPHQWACHAASSSTACSASAWPMPSTWLTARYEPTSSSTSTNWWVSGSTAPKWQRGTRMGLSAANSR